jgi:nitroimidazol reductase NimA-like FMN-containing flavoprotein (pyridoxamine 5'-phosphate oxidase superfamily)
MSTPALSADAQLKDRVLEILDENRILTIATLRPDGWPQATQVGFVHKDLALYFIVARGSQKFANIRQEPRVSIALGRDAANRLRGLSMAAHAVEVTDPAEIEGLNELLHERYPEQSRFAPRAASSVLLKATPVVISIIDLERGPGEPELIQVGTETAVHSLGADRGRPAQPSAHH